MSTIKTLLAVLFVSASPATALTTSVDGQLQFFATCAGRLSALMEHQWTYDTASADRTKAMRAEMIDLVSAVMSESEGRDVLLLRVQAKHAQAALLHRATLSWDAGEADWAQDRAEALLTECTSILMGSAAHE